MVKIFQFTKGTLEQKLNPLKKFDKLKFFIILVKDIIININTLIRKGLFMLAPTTGSNVQIKSYKHDGKLHRIWDKNFILKGSKKTIIGANDKVKVTESNGETWTTKENDIFY